MTRKGRDTGAEDGQQPEGGTPMLEWISAALGLLVTLVLLGFIGWQAWRGGDGLPAIEVRAERILPAAGGWVVEVVAENLSSATAAAVGIEGVLTRDGRIIAVSRLTLDYVPSHSERTGGLFFAEDPQEHRLGLRPLGYAEP